MVVRDAARVNGRAAMSVRVGTDLCSVDTVQASVEAFGDRYLDRIYTPQERAYADAAGDDRRRCEHLAARFAAKEAVVKVLAPPDARPEWRSIEVVRQASGACAIEVTGEAARMAADLGIEEFSVSLTHEADLAAATVVAIVGATERPSGVAR